MIEEVTDEQANTEMMRLYEIIYEVIGKEFVQGTEPLAIAAVLVSTGLRIYRTTLSEEHYDEATSYIFDNRDKIQPFSENVTLQ